MKIISARRVSEKYKTPQKNILLDQNVIFVKLSNT